jgi:YjgF/chorismate_mutase-like, putative endoribonuclease
LTTLHAELGSLDRIGRIVKLLGMVNADPGFERYPEVIDGASDLLVEVFGQLGRARRSRRRSQASRPRGTRSGSRSSARCPPTLHGARSPRHRRGTVMSRFSFFMRVQTELDWQSKAMVCDGFARV